MLVGELARGARGTRARAGWTPPSPWTGSRRIAADVGADGGRERADVVRRARSVTPGTSGSNAARFAGWPVTESAPSVRPWNEPSSATTPLLPVALRAYLSAASFASAPELQKKTVAPPKRSESRPASAAIGSVQ